MSVSPSQDTRPLRVGVLGSGNIGTDLMIKILRSSVLECTAFVGRNLGSAGMLEAQSRGIPVSAESIGYFESNPDACDLVFDATSARDHEAHWAILDKLGIAVVDLTPARVGSMCVPAVNPGDLAGSSVKNVNMVTCGGQASIPLAYAIGQSQKNVEYIEVVSSIASRSAGPATRANLDEYIHTTEEGLKEFSGAKRTKTILNLNPADPCIDMQTTIRALVEKPDLDALRPELDAIVEKVGRYVPGYEVIVGPVIENGLIVVMVRVRGLGDYLPPFAGNLDIINCAAIAVAEDFAMRGQAA